jgi:release factor glutamine methyltransferase
MRSGASLWRRVRLRFVESPTDPRSCTFFDLKLSVGIGVYLPMRTSEQVVRNVLSFAGEIRHPLIVDVGTGCGALALAVAKALPEADIHAVDVSRAALRSAARNRRRVNATNVTFYRGSLLEPIPTKIRSADVVMATLPYLPSSDAAGARDFAPLVAVDGHSDDGLCLLRELAIQAREVLREGGRLVFQLSDSQFQSFSDWLAANGYEAGGDTKRFGRAMVAYATRTAEG